MTLAAEIAACTAMTEAACQWAELTLRTMGENEKADRIAQANQWQDRGEAVQGGLPQGRGTHARNRSVPQALQHQPMDGHHPRTHRRQGKCAGDSPT